MPGHRHILRRYLAAATLGAAVLAAAPARGDDAQSAYRLGVRAYRAGDLEAAVAAFRRSEEADPSYPYPTFALARIYQELFEQDTRHYAEAVRAYEKLVLLLRLNPPGETSKTLYQAHYFRGLLLLKGGDYPNALRSLETFLRLEPDFYTPETVHNAIGIALYYLDQYDQAVESFRTALAANPDYAEARFNLRSVFTRLAVYNEAVAIGRAGELEIALEKVSRLKEFAPRYLPGRRLEAKLLQALGREQEASRVYSEMLGIDPRHPITYHVRLEMARYHLRRGETAEARRLVTEDLRLFPDIADERAREEALELAARLGPAP